MKALQSQSQIKIQSVLMFCKRARLEQWEHREESEVLSEKM